jgi:glutamine synthetase
MATMTAADVIKTIKDKEVKFLDLRFTDTKGKMQHVTADASCVDADMFADGYAFDGSSIAGWKGIEASDMTLMLDPASAHMDPFFAQSTMAIFCDVIEPSTGELYERDPRGIAKKAEAYMKSTGVGDAIYFGPEAEFFIFDDVRFTSDPYNTGFVLDGS